VEAVAAKMVKGRKLKFGMQIVIGGNYVGKGLGRNLKVNIITLK